MTDQQVVFRAAWVRVVLGVFSLTLLPLLYPGLARWRWVFAIYVGYTLVEQVLVWKDIGGQVRSFVSGIVDLAILTFIVQRAGSLGNLMISVYLFAGVMNALVVSFPVGMALSATGSLLYAGVLLAEQLGWLPHAPAAPPWLRGDAPTPEAAAIAAALVAFMMLFATGVVGLLVKTVRRHEAELRELSQRDPLTQLYNRRHLLTRAEAELARVRRGHPLALVMIDLDGFKRVNDSQGHLRGDMLLKELSEALARAIRETDVAGRYGGDEFVVLLPDTDADHAGPVAERLAETIADVGRRFDAARPVTASVGLAVAQPGDAVAALLRRADDNAYRAKQAGGNRVIASA